MIQWYELIVRYVIYYLSIQTFFLCLTCFWYRYNIIYIKYHFHCWSINITVIRNPEVSRLSPVLLAALSDPANKTKDALEALLECEFMHSIDAPSLALLVYMIWQNHQYHHIIIMSNQLHKFIHVWCKIYHIYYLLIF